MHILTVLFNFSLIFKHSVNNSRQQFIRNRSAVIVMNNSTTTNNRINVYVHWQIPETAASTYSVWQSIVICIK